MPDHAYPDPDRLTLDDLDLDSQRRTNWFRWCEVTANGELYPTPEQLLANLPTVLRALCDYFFRARPHRWMPRTDLPPSSTRWRHAGITRSSNASALNPSVSIRDGPPPRLRRGVAWAARLFVKSDRAGRYVLSNSTG